MNNVAIVLAGLGVYATHCRKLVIVQKWSLTKVWLNINYACIIHNNIVLTNIRNCYTYGTDGAWKLGPQMVNYTMNTAITQSPFNKKHQDIYVTGGFGPNGPFSETEILTESGGNLVSPFLPVIAYYHCMVLLNSTAAMVIGGVQNGAVSKKTYIITNENRVKFLTKNN